MQSILLLIKKHPFLFIVSIAFFFVVLLFPILILILLFIGWIVEIKLSKSKRLHQPTNYRTKKGTGSLTSDPFMSALEKRIYLQSAEWKALKQQRLALANNACEHCGCKSNLHLHHVTYKRLGAEELSDLRIVCFSCHNKIHEKLGKDRLTDYPLSILKN